VADPERSGRRGPRRRFPRRSPAVTVRCPGWLVGRSRPAGDTLSDPG